MHMTREVEYRRGAEAATLQATIGRTVFDQQDQFGVIQRTESRDYLIRAQDLVLGGEQTTPKTGDRIVEVIDDEPLIYEVMAPGDEPPWRFSDPGRITLRIHTKFIGQEFS